MLLFEGFRHMKGNCHGFDMKGWSDKYKDQNMEVLVLCEQDAM